MKLILLRKQPQKLAVVRQYLVAVLASLPFAVAGAAVAWPSSTLPKALIGKTILSLDTTETSWMVSILYLGEAVGALPSVYLSDKIGRKKTILYSGVFPIISWSIILARKSALWLYVSRFLAGLQIGVVTVVYPLYMSEVSQTDIRESLIALSIITLNAGIFFFCVVGPFVSSHVLVSIFVFLSLLCSISFQFAPESPYFMLTQDDTTRARNSLLWLRGDLNRIELEFELNRIEKCVETEWQGQDPMTSIFSSDMIKTHLVLVLMSALDALSGVNVIQAYASVMFPKTAFGLLTPNGCMIIISSVTLMSSFVATTYISDWVHGMKLGIASYLGCSASMGIVSVWFYLSIETDVNITLDCVPFLGCLVNLMVCSYINVTSLLLINNKDLSSKTKTNLTVLSTITKATIHFLLNKVYLEIVQWKGVYVNFGFYSVSCLVAAFFLAFLGGSIVNDSTLEVGQERSTEDEHSKSSMIAVNGVF